MRALVQRFAYKKSLLTRVLSKEAGATAVEYAIMIGLIILSCIAAIFVFGGEAAFTWLSNSQEIGDAMQN